MNTITTNIEEQTIELAVRLAKLLAPGDLVALMGDLGAGKTVFAKGIAKGIGVKEHTYVSSPSFVILKEYIGTINLYHFDVYRLSSKEFSETIDYKKYFYTGGITVIEWADKIRDLLPEKYIEVHIDHVLYP